MNMLKIIIYNDALKLNMFKTSAYKSKRLQTLIPYTLYHTPFGSSEWHDKPITLLTQDEKSTKHPHKNSHRFV